MSLDPFSGPGISSPPIPPVGGLVASDTEGPLHFMARALQQRLQAVFPPSYFDWHWLDGKMGKAQWNTLARRTPNVGLGWSGVAPDPESQAVFVGRAQWFLSVVTRNTAGPQGRLLGDQIAPGIVSMVRTASLALQGFVIDPPDTPWAASGAVRIDDIVALASEDWTDEALAAAGINISVPYEEALPPKLDTKGLLAVLGTQWTFTPGSGAFTDTINPGA